MLRKIMALMLMLSASITSWAADISDIDTAINKTAEYIQKTVKNPLVGSIGGEWAVLGLARSGYEIPEEYYESYYKAVEDYVKKRNGLLHDKKYTEYSRVILGLTAAGYDPRNVAGYDLTIPLGDFEKTIWQGINGPIFALISLDSADYPMPKNESGKTQATRDLYIDEILSRQLTDGGFNLTAGANGTIAANEKADPDLTGMALQALAKYQHKPKVKRACDSAIDCLSKMQAGDGGFASFGTSNSESAVQVLVALSELGINAEDPRFIKNGVSIIDNILTYQNDDGSFNHTADGSGENLMATEQAFYGLVSAKRALENKNSLYRMADAVKRSSFTENQKPAEQMTSGLEKKHEDVKQMAVFTPGKTFDDIKGHINQYAIESLAERGIIGGKSESVFDPDATMTRAEFAAITTKALGNLHKTSDVFSDVDKNAWYADYVGTAYSYGIVTGTSEDTFNPDGTITRQEAALMTARAAKLCGMDTEMNDAAARDILAQFGDYVTMSEWAWHAAAFCYDTGILDDNEFDIRPFDPVKRCEIAQMIYNMLDKAKLL